MKKIEAIVRPHKLDEIYASIKNLVNGMTIMEVKGFGRQRGHTEIYRGSEYNIDFLPKIQINVVCHNEVCNEIIEKIEHISKSGKVGDGKIFIYNVEEAIRIRTGERGNDVV